MRFFQQTISHMRKCFTEWGHCVGHQWSYDHIHEYMNIMLVNIEFFTGRKKIKPTYFLRSRLNMYDIMKNFNCN